MTKKVLVTGVTGFIGSHCAVELLQQGYDVVGIDNYDNSYDVNDQIYTLSVRTETEPGTYHFINPLRPELKCRTSSCAMQTEHGLS